MFLLWLLVVRAPPQIKRPSREVKPLRKESPGLQPRGPAGRAHAVSKGEKSAGSRERESRARGRDDKVKSGEERGGKKLRCSGWQQEAFLVLVI